MAWRVCFAALVWVILNALPAHAAPATQPHVEYSIVITGSELLEGAYPDGHTIFLTRTLHPLGLHCISSMIADDRIDAIKAALQFSSSKTKLVIVTGGLGPTDNDLTRQALTQFTGIALKENADVLAEMEKRFRTPRQQLRANLRRQTETPTRGSYLKNANGTAVGLIFEMENGTVVVALPGPPRELQPMVRDELLPYLIKRFGARKPGASLTVRFIGLGQSQISQTLNEKAPMPPDVALFSQFEGGRVDFMFVLPEDTAADRKRLEDLKQKILACLGDNIYATDDTSLEEHVAKMLAERGQTLALAEAGTGGSLAAAMNGSPHASNVLVGAYTAPTDEKLRRLLHVSDDQWSAATTRAGRAKLMAEKLGECDWGIVVGEVDRDGVEVAFRLPGGRLEIQRMAMRGGGELVRAGVTTQLLDQLRRKVRAQAGN